MQRTFIIGDIHGCYNTFCELIYKKCGINKQDEIFLLGDYIDRGPYSKEVIDEILSIKKNGFNIKPLMGNHEYMLLRAIESIEMLELWYQNGCQTTLKSFQIDHPKQLNINYLSFFQNLQYYYLLDNYVIVHGGLNFNIENPFNDLESMIWERNKSVDLTKIGGRKLIVGHTPKNLDEIRSSINSDIVYLDGGCVYAGRYFGFGYLVALEINSLELIVQKNIDFPY